MRITDATLALSDGNEITSDDMDIEPEGVYCYGPAQSFPNPGFREVVFFPMKFVESVKGETIT